MLQLPSSRWMLLPTHCWQPCLLLACLSTVERCRLALFSCPTSTLVLLRSTMC